MKYDLKDMAGSVVVLLTIAAVTFAILAWQVANIA